MYGTVCVISMDGSSAVARRLFVVFRGAGKTYQLLDLPPSVYLCVFLGSINGSTACPDEEWCWVSIYVDVTCDRMEEKWISFWAVLLHVDHWIFCLFVLSHV